MFARFASLFLLSATFVSAIPTPANTDLVRGAAPTDVHIVLITLKSTTDDILPQIHDFVSTGNVTDAIITPLVTQLTVAIQTASSALAALPVDAVINSESDKAAIGVLVAKIITNVITVPGALATVSPITTLEPLLASVDAALKQLLVGLVSLVPGVLSLVAKLLGDVVGLLALGSLFSLTRSLLGLQVGFTGAAFA
ncbi:hypothetical protein B0H19DRAFT_540640 [Mycena capillaripes]|nr:hypothetical protein B0H19DRAFT_540640 [Mycena capillaripes]